MRPGEQGRDDHRDRVGGEEDARGGWPLLNHGGQQREHGHGQAVHEHVGEHRGRADDESAGRGGTSNMRGGVVCRHEATTPFYVSNPLASAVIVALNSSGRGRSSGRVTAVTVSPCKSTSAKPATVSGSASHVLGRVAAI